MRHHLSALLFDLGDTIMLEETEVKDAEGTTQRADLIPGMAEALRQLKAGGLRLALVADTRPGTAVNVLRQHSLYELFDTRVVSETLGAAKPDPRMFEAALDALGIPKQDYHRVVMVGNHLEKDIAGANRLGLLSVFLHGNERRRTHALNEDERPRYTVTSAQELMALIAHLDVEPEGARLPQAQADPAELDFVATYAPHIVFAGDEPFLPLVVGYTLFHQEEDSPSFPRRIVRAHLPAWSQAIEYAIWWDWDMGHLYELEHTWSYVNESGELVWAEGSWHGSFAPMTLSDGTLPRAGTHPAVYSQPGKHAFAPTPDWYQKIREYAINEVGPEAGAGGVLVKDTYRSLIPKTPEADALVAAYLKPLAFTPSFQFNRRFNVTREMLVPWPVLDTWIPARVNWWLERLRQSAAHHAGLARVVRAEGGAGLLL